MSVQSCEMDSLQQLDGTKCNSAQKPMRLRELPGVKFLRMIILGWEGVDPNFEGKERNGEGDLNPRVSATMWSQGIFIVVGKMTTVGS